MHYVSIIETLKTYLQKDDVCASCNVRKSNPNDGIMRDYSDGVAFKSFGKNRDTFIRLHFYSDELEVCNALGSRKGALKISVFYFTVGNAKTKYWTNLAHIHLA